MCGRTSLAASMDRLRQRFGADPTRVAAAYVPRYNIAPSQDLLVVTDDAPETMTCYQWGFVPEWADDPADVPNPINARSEGVTDSGMFRSAFQHRRCLVLADGFYEWQGSRGSKQPYRISRRDGEPFAFAGLWSHWTPPGDAATDGGRFRSASSVQRDPVSDGGTTDRWTTTILTTDANSVVDPIHSRMPVILEPDEEETWLAGDPEAAANLLDPYSDTTLEAYPVSKRVNNPSNDDKSLFEEVDIGTQTDLDEFGT